METVKLALLIEKILNAMRTMHYSESTVIDYKYRAFSPIRKYHEKMGASCYSDVLTTEFINHKKECLSAGIAPERQFRIISMAARILNEFNETGHLLLKSPDRMKLPDNPYFKQVLHSFLSRLQESVAEGTVISIKSKIASFLCHLVDIGRKDFQAVSLDDIRSYLIKVSTKNPHSMGNIVFALRKLWMYLKEIGATNLEANIVLQKPAGPHIRVLPCFTKEEVKAMLSYERDGSARRSRNYAILLLVSHTGLRFIDIINLKLSNIDWAKKEIAIVQHKTCSSLSLPLDTSVGNAIAEYILYSRPNNESPYVFLRCMAPFTKLSDRGTGANIIKPYLQKAGVVPGPGRGFHAFRRSMGTWLIESGTDVATAAQILGHLDHDSSKRYVSLSYSGLRNCTMSLSGIEVTKEGLI